MTTHNRIPGNSVEEKEAYILANCVLLSIQNYTLTEYDDCLEDFIHNFLAVYNRQYKTITVDNKQEQTRAGAHRSLIDIFMICKYYFPSCTLKNVIKGLYALNNSLCSQICNTINRRVYELEITQGRLWRSHLEDIDEFNYTEQDYLNILNN